MKKNWDYIKTGNCISTQQPTTGQPTTNRAQSNLFELPRCEGGNRKVTFRASIHTAYRDRKIKENPNGFLEYIINIRHEAAFMGNLIIYEIIA